MFTLFHGTTMDGYRDIVKGEYKASKGTFHWNCSNFSKIYFYDPVAIWNSEFDAEPNSEKDANDMAQRLANEAGQIANAVKINPANQTVVLEFIFKDDNIYFEDLEEDNSCPNMSWAVQMDVNKFNNYILKGKCSIKIHFYKFYPKMSLCYLIPLVNNTFFETTILPKEEQILLSKLEDMECYDLFDVLMDDLEEEKDEMMELLPVKFSDSSTNASH